MTDFNGAYRHTINGELVSSDSSFPAYNPATRTVITQVPDASRAQLDAAVSAASTAFESWRSSTADARSAALNAIADRIERHAEDFMRLLTREQGKPRAGAEWEIMGSAIWCREIAKQRLPVEIVEDTADRRVITRFSPLGVVGGIVPWNFPVLLAIWKIAPALATGNTIVIKPSPFTPLCTLKLSEVCRDAVPPGVLNVVSGGDELGQWMTAHPGIAKVAFTGHTDTGKRVMDVYDEMLRELVAYAKSVKVGDGSESDTQLGPIQNQPQYEKVLEYFEDCRRNGHRFAIGGIVDRGATGWYVPVTLVDNPPEDSRVVREEPFGPILPVLKWRDEADVIRRANDTPYGLGASVWGRNLEAVQRIGAQLEAGTVWLNEIHQYSPHQAFGGHKQSGIGCENSLHGLMEYTNWHTITLNKNAGFGRQAATRAA